MEIDILYERKELAKNFLSLLDKGTISLILYEARRKGKTTFVLNDLAKVARNDHYVFYYSFMKKGIKSDFRLTFLENLRKFFIEEIYQKIQIKQNVNFELNLGFLKIKTSTIEEKVTYYNLDLTSLSDVCQAIIEYSDKPILFIFDEFQEIGRYENTKISLDFLKELRTILDVNRGFFKTIFLGSSIQDINKMFSDYKQPFFRFGLKMRLPNLEDDFIDYLIDKFHEKENFKLDKNKLLSIFKKNDYSPAVIMDLFKVAKIVGKSLNYDVDLIYQELKSLEKDFGDHQIIFNKLNLLDKVILKRITIDNYKITSQPSLNFIKSIKNLENVDVQNIRSSIKKMKKMDVINSEGQFWNINNPNLFEEIDKMKFEFNK